MVLATVAFISQFTSTKSNEPLEYELVCSNYGIVKATRMINKHSGYSVELDSGPEINHFMIISTAWSLLYAVGLLCDTEY